jgi:phosphoglycolate phosphatase
MAPRRLALFDIDGTLLNTRGGGRAALKAALIEVYGTAGRIDTYSMGGRTIRQIVRDLLAEAGVPVEAIAPSFDRFVAVWVPILARTIEQYHSEVYPGARRLVDALAAHPDVLVGLLTANVEATAHLKLEAAGFDPDSFPVGAFGDASEVRADLIPLAIAEAGALSGVDFAGGKVVVFGDAPGDMIAAREAGARAIGVLTGGWDRAALEEAGADCVFTDLSDTEAVVEVVLAADASRR